MVPPRFGAGRPKEVFAVRVSVVVPEVADGSVVKLAAEVVNPLSGSGQSSNPS
jgi:hypothetical protein